jgi:acyl-CoA synthetase (NDP forming)
MAETESVARGIAEVTKGAGKPVLGCLMSLGESRRIAEALGGIPSYTLPETAVKTMSMLAYYGQWLNRPRTGVKHFAEVNTARVKELVQLVKSRERRFIAEPEAHEILACYGLPTLSNALVKTADEAVAAAQKIGYPVVIKIVSPDILHKTEFGGVRVDISSDDNLRSEYALLLKTVNERRPGADIWGVFVQKMAPKGREFILGMNRDPQFGPLLMFGMGGIMVELLRDVTFRVAPVRELSARTMLTEIKGYKLITGFRGEPPADGDKIVECIERLSQLVMDFPELDEVDINPFMAYEKGNGAVCLDARILIK